MSLVIRCKSVALCGGRHAIFLMFNRNHVVLANVVLEWLIWTDILEILSSCSLHDMLLIWKDHMFFLQTAQWKAQDKQHLSPGKSFSLPTTLWEGSQSWCCWIRGRWLDESTGQAQLLGKLVVFNPPIFLPYRTPQTSLRMPLVVTHNAGPRSHFDSL